MAAGLVIGITFVVAGGLALWRSEWLAGNRGTPNLASYARPAESTVIGTRFESCDNRADWFVKGGNVTYFGTNLSFQEATSPTVSELERRGWVVQRDAFDPDAAFFARRDSISISVRRVTPRGVLLAPPHDTSMYATLIYAYVVNTDQCTG